MKLPSLLAVLVILIGAPALPAAPADHLAPIPVTTPQEKEVISLLQITNTEVQDRGVIISLYNPTKYKLTGCEIRLVIPSQKIDRIYSSPKIAIPPLKDGLFLIDAITKGRADDAKVEIIKLSWENPN